MDVRRGRDRDDDHLRHDPHRHRPRRGTPAVAPVLQGPDRPASRFGHPQNGCANCRTLNEAYGFGLGAVRNGEWILQNPALAGYAGVEAYNPTTKIAVAVVTTFREGSFDEAGNVPNLAMDLFGAIGTIASPTSPPVVPS
jgi:hypothetical protein